MDEVVEGQGDTYQARYEAAVEAGREPLMKARAILECLIFTAIHHKEAIEEQSVQIGDFAIVAEVVRDFVCEALEMLDLVNLIQAARGEPEPV